MFRRGVSRNDSWQGVVTGKGRSAPDGQNMYHRIVVALSDGSTKEIRVRRALWNTLSVGDRLVKKPGDKDPARSL